MGDTTSNYWWAEEDGTVVCYMCRIDYEHEVGGACGGNRVYPSIEDLKQHHKCWESCGIVEVRIQPGAKVIVEGTDN